MEYAQSTSRFIVLWFTLCVAGATSCLASGFRFVKAGEKLAFYMGKGEQEVVRSAYRMFDEDYRQVFDCSIALKNLPSEADVLIGTLGNDDVRMWAEDFKVDAGRLDGLWEAFRIQVIRHEGRPLLVVLGSDPRGTAYGVLELSRLIGVSPWTWWADVVPGQKQQYVLSESYVNEQKPSVQYRGIFINDEDWGLMPWSSTHFEPAGVKGRIGPKTYEQVFRLLLRLRANTLWPAMHECTVPFYFTDGNKEMAGKYGIVLGTSHCEPLMRNNAGEWDKERYGDYNYLTNQAVISDYWRERLGEAGRFENVYTIGMRGVHDGKMEGARTLDEQTAVMQRAMNHQRELLAECVNPEVAAIPQVFVPYKEVLEVYDNGLEVPDDVTLVWCDDNYGYITRLSNDAERERKGGAGVYYHISYWGRPHDYLWLSTTSPAQIYTEMIRAWNHGAQKLWILNAGDIKPAEYETEFFLDLAWNIGMVAPETIFSHLQGWLAREFGEHPARDLTALKKEYYHLATIRKPEFMGWSRVEQYDAVKNGRTPVADTEFNPYMFGDELQRRIDAYQKLSDDARRLAARIPEHRKDAYFQLIEYPVVGAAAINHKLLYAQKARLAAKTLAPETNRYARASRDAYQEIVRITDRYNNRIAWGKWKGMMDMKPRDLAVFQPGELPEPVLLVAAPVQPDALRDPAQSMACTYASEAPCIAWNADTYNPFDSTPLARPVEGLGHSRNAVIVPRSGELRFDVDVPQDGDCVIRVGTIPNHAVDGGDLRYEISIDGGEPQVVSYKTVGRSETWKLNVLRNQSLTTTHHTITRGKHTIRLRALDDGVIADQLMLDFDPARKFYQIPVY